MNFASFSIVANALDALTSLETLVARMDQAMIVTLFFSYDESTTYQTHRPVINSQVNMESALIEIQAAVEFLRRD